MWSSCFTVSDERWPFAGLIASLYLFSEPTANEGTKTMLLERQKEYKMAALRAKKQGDLEQARLYLRTSKVGKKTGGFVYNQSRFPLWKFGLFLLFSARS